MEHPFAELILLVFSTYLAIGVVFALGFAWRGWRAIESPGTEGTIVFRILLIPGATLLWPLLLRRWLHVRRTDGNPEEAERA